MPVESITTPWWLRIRRQGALARGGWLIAIGVVSGALLGLATHALAGKVSWGSIGIAGTICLAGALVSLALAEMLSGPRFLLHRVLAGTLVRMAPPLIALVSARSNPSAWPADMSFQQLGYSLAAMYLVLLAGETLLSLPESAPTTVRQSAAS